MTDEEQARGSRREVSDKTAGIVVAEEAIAITGSRAEGTQTATLELRRHEHKTYIETKRLEEEHAQKAHVREHENRDNETRRRKDWILFCLVIVALAGGFALGVGLMI